MGFVINPNLPENDVKLVIIGNYPKVITTLRRLGTEAIVPDDNQNLQKPVQLHADMSVLHLGKEEFLSYDAAVAEALCKRDAHCAVPIAAQKPSYPQDIGLNCLIIDKFMVCNTRYCAREVLITAERDGKTIINVNQGYARCSVAVINKNSVITADVGIADKLSGEGFDVLRIRSGSIELPGYNHGFIGGCCGKLSKDKILFCGNPANHPDGKLIIDFINSKGIQILTTDNELLFDFGGIVQVLE